MASVYRERQQELVHRVRHIQKNSKEGFILLIGAFDVGYQQFIQDSSFYYYTGIEEPGCILLIELDGKTTLYIPQYKEQRSKWLTGTLDIHAQAQYSFACDYIAYLGEACRGYQPTPLFSEQEYKTILKKLTEAIDSKHTIYTTYSTNTHEYIQQKFVLDRLQKSILDLEASMLDISPIIANMRRKKSQQEIETLYKAVYITLLAQEGVAYALEPGKNERYLQAVIEFIFTENGALSAFSPIVASGKNGTVLHYTKNSSVLEKDNLVIVDIGARYEYYCADLTRTYPISGSFTKRQHELYSIVLETQQFIASIAAPGYWLLNKEHPDKSLHHLAQEFLAERGYKQYFTHGIGHFLGLDVHDVGSYTEPLQSGDVITIEPGLYIPEEQIGIRIEDNYWVVDEGVVCLSQELVKEPQDIEKLVKDKAA
jgi:Xaa-Pro aminopeptidase